MHVYSNAQTINTGNITNWSGSSNYCLVLLLNILYPFRRYKQMQILLIKLIKALGAYNMDID
jgi:hypothetical protein